ncbi:unnamed protein product, partial [Owenia fusiformis]
MMIQVDLISHIVLLVIITGISGEYCPATYDSFFKRHEGGFSCPCGDRFSGGIFGCDNSKSYCCEFAGGDTYHCCSFGDKYGAKLSGGIVGGIAILIVIIIIACCCCRKRGVGFYKQSTTTTTTYSHVGGTVVPPPGPIGPPAGYGPPPPGGAYPMGVVPPPQSTHGSYNQQGMPSMGPSSTPQYPSYQMSRAPMDQVPPQQQHPQWSSQAPPQQQAPQGGAHPTAPPTGESLPPPSYDQVTLE